VVLAQHARLCMRPIYTEELPGLAAHDSFFVCFVASGISALVHGSAGQLLGAIKQTKNRARLLLATPQWRLAFRRNIRSQFFGRKNKSGNLLWWLTVLVTQVCTEFNFVLQCCEEMSFHCGLSKRKISAMKNEKHRYRPKEALSVWLVTSLSRTKPYW